MRSQKIIILRFPVKFYVLALEKRGPLSLKIENKLLQNISNIRKISSGFQKQKTSCLP